jgi:hypothetical protein
LNNFPEKWVLALRFDHPKDLLTLRRDELRGHGAPGYHVESPVRIVDCPAALAWLTGV